MVGASEIGVYIAQVLSRDFHEVTLVEAKEEVARRVRMGLDVKVLVGNGADPFVLEEAGILTADMVIAVTDRDETNLLCCFVASCLSKLSMKVARVRDRSYRAALERIKVDPLRIDLCLHPEEEAALAALRLMEIPGGREVAEFADGRVLLVGTTLDRNSPFLGSPLKDVQEGVSPGGKILIAALRRGSQLIIPHGADVLREGDEVFLVAERDRVIEALTSLGKCARRPQRVILYGASKVALHLASLLDGGPFSVKFICSDEALCNRLLGRFNKVAVLCGEGTDHELLLQFNVHDADYFISASDDEEENILVCLLAKRLGAITAMALVSRLSYVSIISAIGVDVVLNPQLATVDRLLRHVRRGEVIRVATMGAETAEALEAIIGDSSHLAGTPLKDLRFPKEAIIGAVIRKDRVIIPHGDTVMEKGDRAIIFAKREVVKDVEGLLAGEPEGAYSSEGGPKR